MSRHDFRSPLVLWARLLCTLVALTGLATPALAWNGSSRGHLQWLSAHASSSTTIELVITHEPNGRTRMVGTLPLPGELGDGVLSMRIEAALLNAGRTSLPDPSVNLRYTEYFNNGDLAFTATGATDGSLRLDSFDGGLDLAFVATLYAADGTAWRQLSYTGAPLTPIDADDLQPAPPPGDDGTGFVAAVLAPNSGCGSGYEDDYDDRYDEDRSGRTRDPDDDDDSDNWQWDNTATGASTSTGGGCDADDTDDYSDDSGGGCDGDDVGNDTASEAGSGCDSSSSDAASGCDGGEAASGCDCGGDALANSSRGRRGRSAWIARAVSWLPYFAVFGLLRLSRRRRESRAIGVDGELDGEISSGDFEGVGGESPAAESDPGGASARL